MYRLPYPNSNEWNLEISDTKIKEIYSVFESYSKGYINKVELKNQIISKTPNLSI